MREGEVYTFPPLDCVPALVLDPSSVELVRPVTGEDHGLLGAGVASVGDKGRALFVGIRDRNGVTHAAALPLLFAILFRQKLSAAIAELAVP